MSEPVTHVPLLDSPSPDILYDSPVGAAVLEPAGPAMESNRRFTDFRVSSTRLCCSAVGVLNGDGRVDLPVESLSPESPETPRVKLGTQLDYRVPYILSQTHIV